MKAYTRELLRAKLLELTKLQREHDQTGAYAELDAFLEEVKDAFGRLRSPVSAIVANVQSEIQTCIESPTANKPAANRQWERMCKYKEEVQARGVCTEHLLG